MKPFLKVMLCMATISIVACGSLTGSSGSSSSSSGSSTGDSGGVTTVGNPSGSSTVYYDAVLQVMPVFGKASSSSIVSKSVTTTWTSGNPLYDVFYILQEFDADTDQGVIDTSNLYKTMWEGKNFFANTKSDCTGISEQTISPPFGFGNPPMTYNCAYNVDAADGYDFGGAMKEMDSNGTIMPIASSLRSNMSAPVKHGVFGFVWAGSHNEYGSFQGSYSDITDDLSLDIAVWVDYSGENDYCYRNDIDGNVETHLFMFRSIKGNNVAGSNFTSIVGKGYSQGTGKHFLLKINATGLDSSRYYCIGADDGETQLKAMSAEGSTTVDANCAELQADVDAMTHFTTADLACKTADFNPAGSGVAAEGTVFLSFH